MERYQNTKLYAEINYYYVKNSVKNWTQFFLEVEPKKKGSFYGKVESKAHLVSISLSNTETMQRTRFQSRAAKN